MNLFILSHDSVTCSRSPQVSSIAFHAQPPDLPPVPLMDVGFAILCSLARHRRPPIQFLSIASRVCSALLSDLALRPGPSASLSLHLHQAVKRTFTSKLSNMLGTQTRGQPQREGPPLVILQLKESLLNGRALWAERLGVGIISAGVPSCSLPLSAYSLLQRSLFVLSKLRYVPGHMQP